MSYFIKTLVFWQPRLDLGLWPPLSTENSWGQLARVKQTPLVSAEPPQSSPFSCLTLVQAPTLDPCCAPEAAGQSIPRLQVIFPTGQPAGSASAATNSTTRTKAPACPKHLHQLESKLLPNWDGTTCTIFPATSPLPEPSAPARTAYLLHPLLACTGSTCILALLRCALPGISSPPTYRPRLGETAPPPRRIPLFTEVFPLLIC